MRYDLVDLRLFLHVLDEGSITAGAVRMHLSLPSASARVRSLERQAGVDLLVRGRRGVRPTPAGTSLARHARDVLTHTARLESAVAGYRRSPAAPLVLLAGTSATHRLVPRALASFLAEHPDVDVEAAERPTPDTLRMLADGEADLGIVVDDGSRAPGPGTEPLGDDSLVVIGRAGGVLAGREELTYREVAEHPLVGLDTATPLHRWITGRLGEDAPVARVRTRAPTIGTVVTLAAAGVGLAVLPRRAVDPAAPLEVCALRDPWSRRSLSLAWGTTARRDSDATAALAEHVRRAAGVDHAPGPDSGTARFS
ncbi:DNA-binding transcriptional LysR family regulator [Pseudonocardia sediminis]|uniref:DNA-binding transcriptional LysR family regulator n=1 Tax=Pseudonocardia sediminis TaxID=1397368 RepID=A0A4Q7UP70_PSEST|nr:LysR family transcriptional regulator [Pseudonocardia sediminis]RZT83512.1 DNA-binding transcriptional LysR family regulator [Pseudonocardia sediminis]